MSLVAMINNLADGSYVINFGQNQKYFIKTSNIFQWCWLLMKYFLFSWIMSFIHPVLGVNCSFEAWSEHLDVTSDIVRGWMMCESSKSLSNFEINSINLVSFINLIFLPKILTLYIWKNCKWGYFSSYSKR